MGVAIEITLEELLIELILQDLKHNQLIFGLDRLNLDAGYCHFLGILDLIQSLMGVPDKLMDDFTETYMALCTAAWSSLFPVPVKSSGHLRVNVIMV